MALCPLPARDIPLLTVAFRVRPVVLTIDGVFLTIVFTPFLPCDNNKFSAFDAPIFVILSRKRTATIAVLF
jgi:hypothetical protein